MTSQSWKRFVIICLMMIGAFILGYCAGEYRAGELVGFAQHVSKTTQVGHMLNRFNRAYSNELAVVALWEGTNLIDFLAVAKAPNENKVGDAEYLIPIYVRLSILFQEIGMKESAEMHADRAVGVLEGRPGRTKESALVFVQEIMERDMRIRKAASGKQ